MRKEVGGTARAAPLDLKLPEECLGRSFTQAEERTSTSELEEQDAPGHRKSVKTRQHQK